MELEEVVLNWDGREEHKVVERLWGGITKTKDL